MAFLALIIGAVLIVATIRNTHGQLMSAIRQDVPAFAIWGAAIFGVAMIGFIPGLKPVSRGLLALLIVVIVLTNYKQILGAFQGVAYNSEGQAAHGVLEEAVGAGGGGPSDNGKLLSQLSSLINQVTSGQSGDYTDLFGPTVSQSAPSNSSAAPTPIPYDDAEYGASKRSAAALVMDYIVAPVAAVAQAVSSAVSSAGGSGPLSLSSGGPQISDYGPSPVTASDPLGTASAHQWQKDTFSYEAANLAALVASGQVSKSDPGYQSKLDYLANLTGGVATRDAEMAKLKAMGL